MSDYTPTTEEVANEWAFDKFHDPADGVAAFQRMIAAVEREAAARALAEAAEIAEALDFGPAPPFSRASAHQWGARQAAVRIRARAAEIREERGDE